MATHNDIGKTGEVKATEYLKTQGYEILARNWRHGRAEIDIIARIGNDLVFVEVKTRSTDYFGYPEESVSKAKQALLQKAADAYLGQHNLTEADLRFDIIAVIIEDRSQKVYHITDAFWPNDIL